MDAAEAFGSGGGSAEGLDILALLEDAVVIEQDGRIIDASVGTQRALGRMASEVVGLRVEDLVEPNQAQVVTATRTKAATGHAAACTVHVTDGTATRRCAITFHPPGHDGRVVVLVRDVTRLERVAAETALLRRVTELANLGTDATAALEGAMRDIRRTMGWRAGHLLIDNGEELVDAGYWDVADDTDLPDVAADAEPIVAVPVVADGRTSARMEFFADGPIDVDDELRRLLDHVGGQLGLVVARQRDLDELESSREELQRSNAELERFAYVASHDLQEPLRKIVGFAELLQRHHEPHDEEEAEYLGYLVDAARRMQRLIKDLLAYSRAGRRAIQAVDVDLNVVLAQGLDDLSMEVSDANAVVEVGPLPVVQGDAGQLREVFANLVANALKYRDEARVPVIRIYEVETEDDTDAEVVVADNGIGIDAEQREAVFQVFRRLHPAHLYAGTGLGLALVKVIVERHGGRVWLQGGESGVGIQVHIRLPQKEPSS